MRRHIDTCIAGGEKDALPAVSRKLLRTKRTRRNHNAEATAAKLECVQSATLAVIKFIC